MGAISEEGVGPPREGRIVSIEGLPVEFEVREDEDSVFLYHNPCGNRISVFGRSATLEEITKASAEHWCPKQSFGVGVE